MDMLQGTPSELRDLVYYFSWESEENPSLSGQNTEARERESLLTLTTAVCKQASKKEVWLSVLLCCVSVKKDSSILLDILTGAFQPHEVYKIIVC